MGSVGFNISRNLPEVAVQNQAKPLGSLELQMKVCLPARCSEELNTYQLLAYYLLLCEKK